MPPYLWQMIETIGSLVALLLVAFGAATILPFQSEVVLAGFLARGEVAPWVLVVVASIGNTLGSVANWYMGLWIEHYRHRRWFPVTESQLNRAQRWYQRWGLWSLLLSWAPFADALTLVAGIMRTPLWIFVLIVSVAKTGRYIVVTLFLLEIL